MKTSMQQIQTALGCSGDKGHLTEHGATAGTGRRTQFSHWAIKFSDTFVQTLAPQQESSQVFEDGEVKTQMKQCQTPT